MSFNALKLLETQVLATALSLSLEVHVNEPSVLKCNWRNKRRPRINITRHTDHSTLIILDLLSRLYRGGGGGILPDWSFSSRPSRRGAVSASHLPSWLEEGQDSYLPCRGGVTSPTYLASPAPPLPVDRGTEKVKTLPSLVLRTRSEISSLLVPLLFYR